MDARVENYADRLPRTLFCCLPGGRAKLRVLSVALRIWFLRNCLRSKTMKLGSVETSTIHWSPSRCWCARGHWCITIVAKWLGIRAVAGQSSVLMLIRSVFPQCHPCGQLAISLPNSLTQPFERILRLLGLQEFAQHDSWKLGRRCGIWTTTMRITTSIHILIFVWWWRVTVGLITHYNPPRLTPWPI